MIRNITASRAVKKRPKWGTIYWKRYLNLTHSNFTKDRLRQEVSQHFNRLPRFIDSHLHYKHDNRQVNYEIDQILDKYLPSKENIYEYLNLCSLQQPVEGSFVEVLDYTSNTPVFGMVVSRSTTLFNEAYNKIKVFTLSGSTIEVSPQNISFHLYGIFSENEVNNFTDNDKVKLLDSFTEQSMELVKFLEAEESFNIAYAHNSHKDHIVPVDFYDIIPSIRLNRYERAYYQRNRYNRGILLMAIHLGLCKNPTQWMVPTMIPNNRITNVAHTQGCSNSLPPMNVYTTQSHVNKVSIESLLMEENWPLVLKSLSELEKMQTTHTTRKSIDDLSIWLSIWAPQSVRHLINIMKLYIIYPHHQLRNILANIPSFNDNLSPEIVHKYLIMLNIYDSSKDTDIFLSSNLLGTTDLELISISSADDLSPSKLQQLHIEPRDLFSHLRVHRKNDLVIYAVPSGKFGFSLVKNGKNDYQINIHFPDPATRIGLHSDAIKLMNETLSYNSWEDLKDGSTFEIFGKKFMGYFKYRSQIAESKIASELIADKFQRGIAGSQITCMTLSFIFKAYNNDPFMNMENNVFITLDNITKAQIKTPTAKELEDVMSGSRKSTGFTFFRQQINSEKQLNDSDIHSIRFIHNVLKTYDRVRNHKGAINNDPAEYNAIEDGIKMSSKLNENPFLIRFQESLSTFSEELGSLYCYDRGIVVFNRVQTFLENFVINDTASPKSQVADLDSPPDGVLIRHNNVFLPEFVANSYDQTLMARDKNAYNSINARICGHQFLGKSLIQVTDNEQILPLVPKGLSFGGTKLIDALHSFESLLNQMQIVCYLHSMRAGDPELTYMEEVEQYSHLGTHGYETSGPMNATKLKYNLPSIEKYSRFQTLFKIMNKQFWVIRDLERQMGANIQAEEKNSKPSINNHRQLFSVILTDLGYTIDGFEGRRMAKGYCKELGIEVQILIGEHTNDTIGSLIEKCEILYVNSIEGKCVMTL